MAAQTLRQLRLAYTHTLILSGRLWRRLADEKTDAHGISEAKALPLVLIARMGGEPRQNAVADAVGIEGPTLVRLLDQLESGRLISRKEDPTDRRAKVLSLTPAGRAVVAKIEEDLTRLREEAFRGVSAADLQASLRVFKAMQDYVDTLSARPASQAKLSPGE